MTFIVKEDLEVSEGLEEMEIFEVSVQEECNLIWET